MALNCGIVGLPNVGKTVIFQALSGARAETANYNFSTIDPNVGMVNVDDKRLITLTEIFKPRKMIPATVEFVDISGLVKGSSRGEGLGNQFLAHIRDVGVIAHVVRCFEDPDIIHVSGKVDPLSDIETINIELAFADLDSLTRRRERVEKQRKSQAKTEQKLAETTLGALDKIAPLLENGLPARQVVLSDDEKSAVYDCHFITMKPQLYVCNVGEDFFASQTSAHVKAVQQRALEEGSDAVVIAGKFEADLIGLDDEAERLAFMEDIGLKESGLSALINCAYRLLGLRTFFTTGEDECRAWTIHAGDTAPKAAGVIHTDFERGFIKAEVYTFEDIVKYGTEAKIKEAGKYRLEGKEYIVQDGDVIFFKFNVGR